MTSTSSPWLFPLGQVVATPAALTCIANAGITPLDLIVRHANGDYGDIDRDDIAANLLAIKNGFRVLSMYRLPAGRVYVITEADRSSTCVLLTGEY
jgi:hypothetical protein